MKNSGKENLAREGVYREVLALLEWLIQGQAKSKRSEGWTLVATLYETQSLSGFCMEVKYGQKLGICGAIFSLQISEETPL